MWTLPQALGKYNYFCLFNFFNLQSDISQLHSEPRFICSHKALLYMLFFFLWVKRFYRMTWGFTDFFFFLLKSRNYSLRRIYYKNSYLRKNLLDFKYLLILLKTLDCLLFVLKLFFSCRCWKIHQYFIWHKKKTLCAIPQTHSQNSET